ncbi:MAG: S49 family peptidase [Chloroflexi bacterium]|nr:MAG: S49 family peptidase [Chloroflexota bacterium]
MDLTSLKWEQIRIWLLWLVLPLLIGVLIASFVPRPVIGLVRLEDAINSYTARDMITQINYAIDHPEIRAVVLAINSPGGTVVDTEAVYMELARLRAKKPVVIAINGIAASGGYYLSVNSDYIYAKPTSLVGNIGVIGYLPQTPMILEEVISTGPYKLWGSPRDTNMRQIEMIKLGFYEAVRLGRSDRLKIEPELLLTGEIWPGTEALRFGLIDDLGTETDAFVKAADLAHVRHYKAVDLALYEPYGIGNESYPFFLQSSEGITLPYPNKPGIYLLYIPQLPGKE